MSKRNACVDGRAYRPIGYLRKIERRQPDRTKRSECVFDGDTQDDTRVRARMNSSAKAGRVARGMNVRRGVTGVVAFGEDPQIVRCNSNVAPGPAQFRQRKELSAKARSGRLEQGIG